MGARGTSPLAISHQLRSSRFTYAYRSIRLCLKRWSRRTPAGVTDISRWSSAATPPEEDRRTDPIPEGWQRSPAFDSRTPLTRPTSGIPPGCESGREPCSGGVAALDHRLIAIIPPGWGTRAQGNLMLCNGHQSSARGTASSDSSCILNLRIAKRTTTLTAPKMAFGPISRKTNSLPKTP